MRRVLLSLPLLIGVAFAATATAPATTSRVDVRGVCNVQGVDIYFWPQGHPAIPAIGFPAYAPAHVEFYKPRDVSNAAAVAYMDVTRSSLSSSHCSSVADAAMPFAVGAPTQTTTATQKLRCTFAANAEIRIGPWNKVTKRFVTRIVKVRGKKKKVRRAVKKVVRVGNLASVGAAGTPGALAEVRLSTAAATSSSMKWDTRSCTPVDVTG